MGIYVWCPSYSRIATQILFCIFSCLPEKLNIRVVDPAAHTGLPSAEERAEIEQAQEDSRQYLCIPRRSVGYGGRGDGGGAEGGGGGYSLMHSMQSLSEHR